MGDTGSLPLPDRECAHGLVRGSPAGTCREETGDDVIPMRDKAGKVIGLEKLNDLQHSLEPLNAAFESVQM